MAIVMLGVDIGQRVDPSAIAVAELVPPPLVERHSPGSVRVDMVTPDRPSVWEIRYLARLPLNTPYPKVAQRVAEVAEGAARQKLGVSLRMRIDITGVGRPVAELIVGALKERKVDCPVEFVTFTFGDHLTTVAGGERRLGKAYLVSRLQSLLQTQRLKLPRTAEAVELGKELLNYEIKVDPDGDAKFGAFKVGSHDDLVTALGLAVLQEVNTQPSMQFDRWGKQIGVATGR